MIGRQNWATPQPFFDKLEAIFGKFALDVCAEEWSAKCGRYFTKEDDGLEQSWDCEQWFCNPPFREVERWVEKGWDAWWHQGARGVMIVPASVDTRWFHDFANKGAGTVIYVKGRIQFGHPDEQSMRNDRGSLLLLFGNWDDRIRLARPSGTLLKASPMGGFLSMEAK